MAEIKEVKTVKTNEVTEVDVISADLPEVRSMTRGQMKEFRAEGFDPTMNAEIGPAVFDWILDRVYADIEFDDDTPYCQLVWLARQTFFATYAMPYEREYAVKNS